MSTSIPIPTQRHASSSSGSGSVSETVRRMLWGTDSPPGQEDPYVALSESEKRKSKGTEDSVVVAEGAPEEGVGPPDVATSNYVPATTWDGLDQIGGATGWWEEAWDQEHPFQRYVLRLCWQSFPSLTRYCDSFMASSKMTSREEVEAAVRRAVIEVFTLKDAERPLTDAVNALDDKVTPNLDNVVFSESDDASVVLNYLDAQVRQEILDSMDLSRREPARKVPVRKVLVGKGPARKVSETQPAEETSEIEIEPEFTDPDDIAEVEAMVDDASSEIKLADDAHQMGKSHTPDSTIAESGWQNVSLGDTDVKFAVRYLNIHFSSRITDYVQVLKRVMQLTGVRIPDHAIEDISTAKALVGHLVKKPKPKKLVESLLVNERLTALPNVQIFDRRYTPIDKEKEIGRWKVIEKELQRRGLPVTGTA